METFVDIISDIGAQISKIKRCRINQQTLINRLIFGSMKLPKDQGEKGTSGDKRFFQNFCFRRNLLHKRKMALVHTHQSRFVYSLRGLKSLLLLSPLYIFPVQS